MRVMVRGLTIVTINVSLELESLHMPRDGISVLYPTMHRATMKLPWSLQEEDTWITSQNISSLYSLMLKTSCIGKL